jgi:hypothetical protein
MRSEVLLSNVLAPATAGSQCWVHWSRIWALIDRARSTSTATITARRSSFAAGVGAMSHQGRFRARGAIIYGS